MRQAGIPPNTITYSAAISACDKAGEWTRALQLLRRMQTEGVPPDLIIFNAAIGACARAGEWQRAVSLLNDGMVSICAFARIAAGPPLATPGKATRSLNCDRLS
eukprot:scaffold7418_cov31-Tisochrysis_lutea.AAC.3